MSSDEMFERIGKEIFDKFMEANPDMATSLGLHEPYDWQLPDGSTERLLGNLRLEEEWMSRLDGNLRREQLNDAHKIEWDIIASWHESSKFFFYDRRVHELDPDAFNLLGGLIFMMFSRNYAPIEKRADAIASRIEQMPRFLEQFRSRFQNSRPVRLWTEIAIETAQNMAGLFQFVLGSCKGRVSPSTYDRLGKAVENLQPALKTQLEWLQTLLSRADEKWALGREKFEKLIALRALGMSSNEILQLGFDYLAKLKAERKTLTEQIAPGKSEAQVMKQIEENSPKTFEEALGATQATMMEARDFVQLRNIATVHLEDVLLVQETPAFLAPLIPFAALMMPAKFDKPQIGVYIVTRPKDVANLGKHLNYAAIRNTAVHEAFPGHFLQGSVSNRGSVIHLLAEGTETIEGWAHYCEEMMAERGFSPDLQARLVRVNDGIWRAVRIIVDVKLSRGEMTFEEAVQMLMTEAAMSREGAEAEVKRYTQTPGYPMSYLLGKHLLIKLRDEMRQKMGAKFDEKLFHDTITANGYLPVSYLRRIFEQKMKAG